jgi:hypothetical protein
MTAGSVSFGAWRRFGDDYCFSRPSPVVGGERQVAGLLFTGSSQCFVFASASSP